MTSFLFSQVEDGAFSSAVPSEFSGIWENGQRLVVFENPYDESDSERSNYVTIILKTFYGWYLDRTAEPPYFDKTSRTRNVATVSAPENIKIEYRPLIVNEKSGSEAGNGSVWELFIHYPGYREPFIIPVAVIDGSLYLDFSIRLDGNAESPEDELSGFWCGIGKASGIKVSAPHTYENIDSLYITPDGVYHIRYWLTDMEYSTENAFFSDDGKTYSVVKHIKSAGRVYTCTSGRSVTIRNISKASERPSVYALDSSHSICGYGEPYLKKTSDQAGEEALLEIVRKANARRAPDPDPPFPPSNLDWHMDEINALEAGNELIQALRQRNREFKEKYSLSDEKL